MRKVLVAGDANVDLIVPFPRFLNEQRTLVEYPSPCLVGGGTCANTAVALSRLGVETGFAGTIGCDQYGAYIHRDFEAEGVDTSCLIEDAGKNTVCVFAFIDEQGERYLWGWPRVDQAFKEMDLERMDWIQDTAWLHSSGMAIVDDTSARSSIIRMFREAYERGIPTSFDLNLRVDNGSLDESYRDAVLEIMKYSNYVLGSGEEEFYYLNPKEDWEDSVRGLVSEGHVMIARMGKMGSKAFSVNEETARPAFQVVVEDTVGAGDVYNAGFIAKRLEGGCLAECLEYGNAVSGYTVERKGARSCPHKNEVEAFLLNRHAAAQQ